MSRDSDALSGIESLGSYVPRYRLTADAVSDAWGQFHGAGISETAVPAADEDTLTMAVEAATRALDATAVDRSTVDGLFVATTTPPLEEEAMGPRLASMLRLPEDIRTRQFTGSTRAGVEALVTALGGDGRTLVVASDAPRGAPAEEHDHAAGAGSVATLVGPSATGDISDIAEHISTYPGTRFRSAGRSETTGLAVTEYDREAFIETVTAAVDSLATDPADVDVVALQSPNGKLPYRIAGRLGVDSDTIQQGTVVHDVGDTGAAGPLLGLGHALADGTDSALLVGYGSGGGATALALEAGDLSLATADIDSDTETLSYSEYLRMRGEITPGEPDGGGAYVSVPNWQRTLPQRHRLEAGRCPDCGALAFPPEGACRDCGALTSYESVTLPGTGTVEAVTVIGQGGAPPEFVEQQAKSGAYVSSVVALDGPGEQTVSVPAQVVDTDPETVEIGDRVEATMRRIYTQEEVTRYGFKMRPAE